MIYHYIYECTNKINNLDIYLNIKACCLNFNDCIGSIKQDTHLIFLDLNYGASDVFLGENFLNIIRRDVKIIVVSGYIDKRIRDRKDPNVVYYLEKNNITSELSKAIETFWIHQENIRSVFRKDHLEYFVKGKKESIYYNQIKQIESGVGKIEIQLKEGKPIIISANIISLRQFEDVTPLIRISNHIIINKNEIQLVKSCLNKSTNLKETFVYIKGIKSEPYKVGQQRLQDVTVFAVKNSLWQD